MQVRAACLASLLMLAACGGGGADDEDEASNQIVLTNVDTEFVEFFSVTRVNGDVPEAQSVVSGDLSPGESLPFSLPGGKYRFAVTWLFNSADDQIFDLVFAGTGEWNLFVQQGYHELVPQDF